MQDDNDDEDEEKQPYEQNDRVKDFMVNRGDSYEFQVGEKGGNERSHVVSSSEDDEVRRTNGSSATASVASNEVHEKANGHRISPECGVEEKQDALPRGDSSKIAKPVPLMKPSVVHPPVKKND